MLADIVICIIGLIIGSFLNACIYRIPLKISIVKPGSFCPHCKKPVPLWSNIPILGFLLLGGKCYHCKEKISLQYPFVELLAGLITLVTFYHFGIGIVFVVYTIFIYFLIVIAFIDAQKLLIPNVILLTMFVFGIITQIFIPNIEWMDAVVGLLAGGTSLYLIGLLGKLLFKKESMGFGDVKFAAVAGFIIGWQDILIALYLSFVIALLGFAILRLIKKGVYKEFVPLGSFISIAIVFTIFWGNELKEFYLQFLLP